MVILKIEQDKSKETYTIVIPPPNVTGKLHLGHAWDTTLQDIITRMKRMQEATIRYTYRYGSCWYCDTGKGRS
ncbi:class I tRNA ligase family protein [Staphylococcus aureus]